MTGRKKTLRIVVMIVSIYIILNILIYGIMTAYMNTKNILSEDKLTMAEVNESGKHTKITILGMEYTADIEQDTGNAITAFLYCAANEKIRACAELITHAKEYFF